MINQTNSITELYCRLSRDDEYNGDSLSIKNQKEMLVDYASTNGFENYEFYVDDGYFGTSFERPDFERLLSDIEKEK
jgi:DNA invertase Pin-like site-specific DNA recombinase